MVYRIIQWWATLFLRLYFRKTIVYGRENIPEDGPLIVASNHPSAFLEASILGTVIRRPLHYLVRGDVFHPKFRWLFAVTNQIPIYRQKDGITNLRKNASSFDLTYRKLAEGEAVLIFPEAKTILEKKMRPIQRGTAHLAFGTLPLLKEGQTLSILPVGVNFTEPRLPGTDVVIRFGKPFLTQQATRDDREAIESFTETLSNAMELLIIQVSDHGYERHYDILASVYLRFIRRHRPKEAVHDDLMKVSHVVNQHEDHSRLLHEAHQYLHDLRKHRMEEAVYFPDLLTLHPMVQSVALLLKSFWLLAGGWIWRVIRHLVFSKIKTVTFQGPSSVGAAMVVFPLLTLLGCILSLIVGWPIAYVGMWAIIMWMGAWIRPSWGLIWKALVLNPKIKSALINNIHTLKEELTGIIVKS